MEFPINRGVEGTGYSKIIKITGMITSYYKRFIYPYFKNLLNKKKYKNKESNVL